MSTTVIKITDLVIDDDGEITLIVGRTKRDPQFGGMPVEVTIVKASSIKVVRIHFCYVGEKVENLSPCTKC